MNQTKTFKMIALMLFFVLCVGTRLQAQFITTWITTDGQITIPTTGGGYNYTVTWTNLTNAGVGNGTISGQTGNAIITGLQNGSTYSVAITGVFPQFFMNSNVINAPKLRTIAQWGINTWTSMGNAFFGCNNLTYTATDNPNLSGVTNMSQMFGGCSIFNGNISGWNTANVTNMASMFTSCTNFNQNIGSWNTINVTNVSDMFTLASNFNQNINGWNTINVTNMAQIFVGCTNFNQNIGGWNTTNVTNMQGVFFGCTNFNQNISSWSTGSVTAMNQMFAGATSFNQNISGWNTTNVTSMGEMFVNATSFNQNIGSWNTTNVTNMFQMFINATAFNQNLASWNIGSVTTMALMLNNSGLSVANYDATLIGWAAQTRSNITLGAAGLRYCTGAAARATLTGALRNWTIIGDAPLLSITNTTSVNGIVGTAYTLNAAATGNTSALTYSVSPTLPLGLSLNTSTGLISGTPTTATASNTYTVTASQSGCNTTQGYAIAITCPAIAFTNLSATNGVLGTAYNLNAVATGLPSFVYSVSPALPLGLSLSTSTGAISGTPTTATASNTYTVTAAQGGCTATRGYTFSIVCPAITFTNTSATNGVLGTAYSLNAATTGLPSPIYSVSPALPLGLSLNTSTGAISGTPTTATVSNTYTVTAAQGGCTAALGYTFAVTCPTIVFTNITAPSGVVGTAYTFSAVATGLPSLVYSVSPALPLGLSLNTSTGLISGTPTTLTASATYTVTAAQGGCSATQGYTFAVSDCTPVVLNPNLLALPNATLGVPYSLTMTATGGTAGNTIYSYTTLTPMPEGLSFVNGFLSGTPRFSTSVTFLVKATTPSGCDGSRAYTLVILPDPATAIDSSLSSLIKVYPNPSRGIFNVDLQGLNLSKSLVRVYDTQGKSVYSSEINSNESSISLENMASGIYLMEINTNKGRILKRLVKQ